MKPQLICLGIACSALAAIAQDIKGPAPVSVSSANYQKTERAELIRRVSQKNAVNPPAITATPEMAPTHFIFLPGEVYESDLTYEELCKLLTPALLKRNLINAADEQGLMREPEKVSLVLRVHYGIRPWRQPIVRTEQLTWRDGLVPGPKGRGLHTLGGDTLWESRAGGNDEALAAARENQSGTSAWGKGAGRSGGSSSSGTLTTGVMSSTSTGIASLTEYERTRDFHIIVIDAFDYAELKKEGKSAKRLWTTFAAAPKEPKQLFSAMAKTLIRNATPYLGETTSGLQVYTDARANVEIGEAIVVP
ncbi:MAG: hypothetical protein K1X42_13315 [Opitutaceae bacterium]|nr:hypothetical protein [Opitutaceae bacterium]